jgi:protein SCO1/2
MLLGLLVFFSNYQKQSYQRSRHRYQVPDVVLLNQRGEAVPLVAYLQADKPVIVEFVFTSCTSLCPSMAVKYVNFQNRLGADSQRVQLVSISVDPEVDTPQVIADYLRHYQARPGWDFLTGTPQTIKQVMDAFMISPADMITLDASILLRSAKTGDWIRINGQLSSEDFFREYQMLEK